MYAAKASAFSFAANCEKHVIIVIIINEWVEIIFHMMTGQNPQPFVLYILIGKQSSSTRAENSFQELAGRSSLVLMP